MWRITKAQYAEVRDQEGRSWYGKEILLRKNGGMPIYVITNEAELSNSIPPSEAYIKTIALGLKETYDFNDEKITNYLIEKDGIKGCLKKDEALKMIASL